METSKNSPARLPQSPRRPARGHGEVTDTAHTSPLSSANFARSLCKPSSKKPHAEALVPLRRPPSCSKENARGVLSADISPRLSFSEFGVAARSGQWARSPGRRRRGSGGEDAGGGGGVLRMWMTRRKEEPEKEEAVHRARVLTVRLLQWRFANGRMEKAMAGAKAAAENKVFYTWLRVAELRNILAAKRVVAQRRRQKLKLARVLPPQLHLLASWEPVAKQHADAVAALGHVLPAACSALPLVDAAQATSASLPEIVSTSVDTVNEIEANVQTFYTNANTIRSTLAELVETIQLEIQGLKEAMQLSRTITRLQMQEVSLRANLIQAKHKFDLAIIPKPVVPLEWSF